MPQNNREGKFKSWRRTGVTWSCFEAKIWHNRPRPAQVARACHLAIPAGCASFPCPAVLPMFDFRAMLFRDFKPVFLALLSAKCHSSFCFFDKVSENTERCYMSKMYAKGG